MVNKVLASFLFLLQITSAKAQAPRLLAHFSGMQTGKVVQIMFVIGAGKSCDGVRILRSTNRQDFSEIGQLTGVCGNSTTDETYSFIDISPVKNAANYYRLELINLGLSDIINVQFIDFGDKEYLLHPKEVKDKSILYFQNDCNDAFDFVLLDKQGKKARQTKGLRGNSVEVEKGNLKSGVYTFRVLIESEVKCTGVVTIL